MLFLLLCLGMILLSQVFYWLGASATYEVVKPTPAAGRADRRRRLDASRRRCCRPNRPTRSEYKVVTETVKAQGPAHRRRHPLPVHVVRAQLHGLHGDGHHPHRHDRRRDRGALGAHRLAHPQARRGVVGRHADLHHRVPRHHLEHRVGRGLPRADPARRRRVQERGPQPAGRDGRGLCGRRRRLRREPARDADRRDPHRDHQRGDPPRSARRSRSTSPRTSTSGSARRSC